MDVEAAVRELAELQFGLVARRQWRELGVTREVLARRLAGPAWDAMTPRVARLIGAPADRRQQLMAGVLDAGHGAVGSYAAAGAVWRLPGYPFGTVETSRTRGVSSVTPVFGHLHITRFLPVHHTTTIDGLPVTSLGRTLFDLAAREHPGRMERLVDSVLGRSPSMLPRLHVLLDELGARGRNGIATMRTILEARPPGYRAPETGLEARVRRILEEAGEEPLELQVDVGGHDWIGRIDMVDRRLKLLVEIDSATFHSSKLDRLRDAERDAALLAAGWLMVLRIAEEDVWYHPDRVLAAIRQARAELRRVAA